MHKIVFDVYIRNYLDTFLNEMCLHICLHFSEITEPDNVFLDRPSPKKHLPTLFGKAV